MLGSNRNTRRCSLGMVYSYLRGIAAGFLEFIPIIFSQSVSKSAEGSNDSDSDQPDSPERQAAIREACPLPASLVTMIIKYQKPVPKPKPLPREGSIDSDITDLYLQKRQLLFMHQRCDNANYMHQRCDNANYSLIQRIDDRIDDLIAERNARESRLSLI